jgi:hypothetical protein
MAGCEADELDLGQVGLNMYQEITKRYVLLRCDYPVSGFYQTDQIQAYPSRSLDCLQDACSASRRGASPGRVIDSDCPTKASCLPNDVFPGPQDSVDYAV